MKDDGWGIAESIGDLRARRAAAEVIDHARAGAEALEGAADAIEQALARQTIPQEMADLAEQLRRAMLNVDAAAVRLLVVGGSAHPARTVA